MPAFQSLTNWILFLVISLSCAFPAKGQVSQTPENPGPKNWIFSGTMDGIKGMGIARYSRFNPEKAWNKAFKNGVNDLNANHSLIVYYYGKQIGRGPLRINSRYAIRTFLDTTQVAKVDSALWNGRAFMLVEAKKPLPDSLIYPGEEFRPIKTSGKVDSSKIINTSRNWLQSTGSTQMINSNWYMSVTKAKQDALRRLAEDLAIEVNTEVYSMGNAFGTRTRRSNSFSTMYAFQRIRVVKRIFNSDTMKVTVAVDPQEVKWLLDE